MDETRSLQLARRVWRAEAIAREAELQSGQGSDDLGGQFAAKVAKASAAGTLATALHEHLDDLRRGSAAEAEVAALRHELAALQSSTAYALGRMVIESIRSPRAFLRLPVGLVRLLRGRRTARVAAASLVEGAPPDEKFDDAPSLTRAESAPESEAPMSLPAPDPLPELLREVRIAAICDRFTADNLGPECHVEFLAPECWVEQIRNFRPQLLFVESAWQGLEGEWTGKVADPRGPLAAIVSSCRVAGIPTVFWNKEDPLHFEAFLSAARLFDLVCTTDAASIPRYKRELGHARVQLLMFALQPRLHHPIRDPGQERIEGSFFAGAWYGRQPERCRDFMSLADALALAGPFDIYDRNTSDLDTARRYPKRYSTMLHGSVDYADTPDLYRKYRIGLSLNTIKHSPTMFARRALELMGTGTSVYSNHSRGLHQTFGHLVVASDDGERILSLAHEEICNPNAYRYRFRRLAALRKVLLEHSWSERLGAVFEQAWGRKLCFDRPLIHVVARVENADELRRVCRMAGSQQGVELRLWLDAPVSMLLPDGTHRLDGDLRCAVPQAVFGAGWLAPWHASDVYGPNYLQDLILALQFDQGSIVGKAAFARTTPDGYELVGSEREYTRVAQLALRRCLMPVGHWTESIERLLAKVAQGHVFGPGLVSIDGLSYLEGGQDGALPEVEATECHLDTGISMASLRRFTATVPAAADPETTTGSSPVLGGERLVSLFNSGVVPAGTSASLRRHRLELVSTLPVGRVDAIFSCPVPRCEIETTGKVTVCLDSRPHPSFSVYLDAMGVDGQVLHREQLANEVNTSFTPPEETSHYCLAIAVRGPFVTHIDGLWLCPRTPSPYTLPGEGRLLVVVNGYPERGQLYRNAFVHRRVLAYRARGVPVDVVWVSRTASPRSFEYEGVSVVVCAPDSLRATLSLSRHRAIAVHFLDEAIWSGLEDAAGRIPTTVWVHGAEIQSWTRRHFNYLGEAERAAAAKESDRRSDFWRNLLAQPPAGLRLVFVSHGLADQVWHDLGMGPGAIPWSVIPNPIDTGLFRFEPKDPSQRYRVLSIRPHASHIYANDLVAETIHMLAEHPLFPAMQFRLIGDGPLFEDNFASLRRYPNVTLDRGFLPQDEIAQVHRDHGLFLVPSRGDTQGVSRDEAMASGLVPISNRVGAISEFVDEGCAMLADAEDVAGLAAGVVHLVEDPHLFAAMSLAARERVASMSGTESVIARELDWMGLSAQPSTEPPMALD